MRSVVSRLKLPLPFLFSAYVSPVLQVSATTLRLPAHLIGADPLRVAQFVAGRKCAEASLRDLGSNADRVGSDKDGRPIWPVGIVGSISHSEEWAIALSASCLHVRALGVDVERVLSPAVCAEIETTFAPEGLSEICKDDISSEWLTTLAFSAKESAYKAVSAATDRKLEFWELKLMVLDVRERTFIIAASQGEWGAILQGLFAWLDQYHLVTVVWWSPKCDQVRSSAREASFFD